jgi:hypothetical protein
LLWRKIARTETIFRKEACLAETRSSRSRGGERPAPGPYNAARFWRRVSGPCPLATCVEISKLNTVRVNDTTSVFCSYSAFLFEMRNTLDVLPLLSRSRGCAGQPLSRLAFRFKSSM